jgi:N-carbamoylputrescine amidase
VKVQAAAIQMASEPSAVQTNLDRAEALLAEAHNAGAELAVLPEMFNTGYGLLPDYGPAAESADGPTLKRLREFAERWKMAIAAGFVEREGHHLYDSLAFLEPCRETQVYRKRNLVFWERFRFRPGRSPLVVHSRFGRIGFAVCADMIYKRVWHDYRDRIDLAIVSSAWPDFACRHTGRPHWLLGHVGELSGQIPRKVALDLGVPVVFANQCGPTRTSVPYFGTLVVCKIADRFAGLSSISDGRHGLVALAGREQEVISSAVTLHSMRGPVSCHFMSPSAPKAPCSALV